MPYVVSWWPSEVVMRCAYGVLVLAAACDPGSAAAPTACQTGTLGCTCDARRRCDEGFLCNEGRCLETREAALHVSSTAARACEVLLVAGNTTVLDVAFGNTVRGALARRGERAALSFLTPHDAPIAGVSVHYSSHAQSAPRVEESRCFDGNNRELPEAVVSL